MEAACVCPLVILSVLFLWYLGFYQHNRIACQGICREAVYKGLDAKRDQQDVAAAVQEVLDKQSAGLLAVDDIRTECSVVGRNIEASMWVRMHFPFGIWKGTEADGEWLIEEQASVSGEHPVTAIRRLRRLQRLRGS